MHRLNILVALVLAFVLSASTLRAQDPAIVQPDTNAIAKPPVEAGIGTPMTKSTTTAVLMSLACPGLGQYYTRDFWKIPLFTGIAGVTAFLFFSNNAKFNDADAAYQAALADPQSFSASRALTVREVYRDNRDVSAVVFLVTYALAAVDAYVGAHLYDFNVDEDVSLGLGPTRTQLMALSFRMRLP